MLAGLVLPTSCTVLRGRSGILAASNSLQGLRCRSAQDADVTTDPEWFTAMAVANTTIPWVVQLFEGTELVAAILLAERCVLGIPSGYLKADGGFGDEFLICAAERRSQYLPLLLRGLFEHRAVLIAHIPQPADADTAHARMAKVDGIDVEWKSRTSHHRLPLASTMEETLAPYGVRTRRNLRYYLRKSRSENCRFSGELSRQERIDAVNSLYEFATHRLPVKSAMGRELALQAVPGSFAMGMQAEDGTWLSYLAGWRRPGRTYAYWQMNRVTGGNTSVSTAIRAFLMEEEIAQGTKEIVFVGGTSQVFMRCCEEDPCIDLIARRRGLRSGVLSRILGRLLPAGHPLSARLGDAAHPDANNQ